MRARMIGALASLRSRFASVAQLAGLSTVAAGFYMLAPWLGVVALGCALSVVGWAYDGSDDR